MRNIYLIQHLFIQAIHVPVIPVRMTEHVSPLGVYSHADVPLNEGTCLCVLFPKFHHLFIQAIHVPVIPVRMTEHVSPLRVYSHADVPRDSLDLDARMLFQVRGREECRLSPPSPLYFPHGPYENGHIRGLINKQFKKCAQ